MSEMITVYRHRRNDTNEIFYVGIGKTEKRAYSKKDRNKHWHNIVNKTDYSVEIISEVDTWEDACELEQFLIQEYGRKDLGTGPLVNFTDGGDGILNPSEETRAKMSKALKGENNPMYGKKHSEETKKKIGDVHRGKEISEETREKMSLAKTGEKHPMYGLTGEKHPRYGTVHSEETKAKIGDVHRGKKMSEEQKAKISKANKGEKHPASKKVINTETGEIWNTIISCAIDNGLNKTTLTQYLNGSRKNKTNLKLINN